MLNTKNHRKKHFQHASRAQAIVLIAVAFAGMVAIVGLMTDAGMLLIQYARLKRGVDAAAIAAAQQFKQANMVDGVLDMDPLTNAATDFININQSNNFQVNVQTCDNAAGDPVLCTTPKRKLVRVTADETVTFGFLRIVGWNSTVITASSVAEAASVDLIFVIDTSISMAAATDYEDPDYGNGSCPLEGNPPTADNTPPGKCQNDINADDDPTVCNYSANDPCEPMADVKKVAQTFADELFYPYDRVGIITLTSQPNASTDAGVQDPPYPGLLMLNSSGDGATDKANVDAAIQRIKVFQPQVCNETPWNTNVSPYPCLYYNTNSPFNFITQVCPIMQNSPTNTGDPSQCNSTDAGVALNDAGSEFSDSANGVEVRSNSFWVVIPILTGPPNIAPTIASNSPMLCPSDLWHDAPGGPWCIQGHIDWTTQSNIYRHASSSPEYSPLDYAMDAADYVTTPGTVNGVSGQGASIFSIGLGNRIENSNTYGGISDSNLGEEFLKYAALTAGSASANHGNYYYAPNPTVAGLTPIFDDIYQNISTRIAQ